MLYQHMNAPVTERAYQEEKKVDHELLWPGVKFVITQKIDDEYGKYARKKSHQAYKDGKKQSFMHQHVLFSFFRSIFELPPTTVS